MTRDLADSLGPHVDDVTFRAAFDASPRPLLLVAADPPKFTMAAVNAAHARAFRTEAAALLGRGVIEVFPKGVSREVDVFVEAIRQSFAAVLSEGKAHAMGVRAFPIQRADGASDERFWSAVNAPVFMPDGRLGYILSAVQDVTGEVLERRSEEARELLMREVDHRARNSLTVVQSLLRLTSAPDVDTYRRILTGRVEALARAQTSLVARRWEGAALTEVVERELAALADAGRYAIEGPYVLLKAGHVQNMSMALHELAINAAKYGGLSQDGGRVGVSWTRRGDELTLTWRERGGPDVAPPTREGFGSRLIRELGRLMQGDIRFDWAVEGLEVEMRLRLDAQQPRTDA
ncbi:MAG: PAS domain-containing protein [Phenylobacterium sp.]|uniref:HWE histidine kinase domain-containing protein n=1 Tax=Phenylobacterium sp. TaxID=1871053 RepID=UPI001A3DBA15|nr:HWE histidine kinase domain-containing protein [Phenylobacterium sp.]MBL8554369.1 PAS domain-containing protein [Phenylobacterium sp.]